MPPAPSLPSGFRRLAWSNLLAQAAEADVLAAAPLLAVLVLGVGAGATGVLAAVQSLPFLLLALPAGVLADRMPRQRLMLGAGFGVDDDGNVGRTAGGGGDRRGGGRRAGAGGTARDGVIRVQPAPALTPAGQPRQYDRMAGRAGVRAGAGLKTRHFARFQTDSQNSFWSLP